MQYIDSVVQSRITKAPFSPSGKNKLNETCAETRVPLDCEPGFVRDYATRSLLQMIKSCC